MKEIWKPIKGYEGIYEISNFGKVKSIRYFNHVNNKIYSREKILKLSLNEKGYFRVGLYKSGKEIKFKVHRLVAENFIPNPNKYNEVNHIDGNKQNNCVDNLEWCTHSHNIKEAVKLGLIVPPINIKK